MKKVVRPTVKEEDAKSETEQERKAVKRSRLCIPMAMQGQILDVANDIPAGGHFGWHETYQGRKGNYFREQMWRDTKHCCICFIILHSLSLQ